jgi:hypothetical protein
MAGTVGHCTSIKIQLGEVSMNGYVEDDTLGAVAYGRKHGPVRYSYYRALY